ncbi:acyltransferase [Siculibacillus lacustris]|uniref:Acyltransferase n=1 Tax=Siculibacillus lacustris TaxID=1549641 RepID=A0A4V2KTZ2_9HYPH|nr:acyltransferase [Siculibacillus lacustris]TBW39255.1 acyltransferase [Siculibacillus lacustris]
MAVGRYAGLDGLRGTASFAVVIHHSLLMGTDIGGLAVFLFFILSGFLITGILHRARLAIEAGRTAVRAALTDFWIRRALRIFPAYYLWLGVFVVLDVTFRDGAIVPELGWYLTYTQNVLIGFVTHAWGDFTHVWSLAVEQQYYVFFAPLVVVVAARRHAALMVATIVLCLVAIQGLNAIGFEMISLYTAPITGFVFMGAGALMTLERERLPALLGSRPALALAGGGIVALAAYPVAERTVGFHLPYAVLVAASASALSVVMIHVLQRPDGFTVRILETRPLKFLGLISYGLYVVHLPIGVFAERWLPLEAWSLASGLPRNLIDFAVMAPLSVAVAAASFFLVEAKFLALKDRFGAAG